MATVTLASLEAVRSELVNSKYYLNIRSGYMAPVTLHCSYGDSGETVTFYIFDGGQELNLAGCSATVHGTRRDGASFGPFTCTTSGNTISFSLQSAMTAVEGSAIAEFSISKNGVTIGTCNFGILVENAVFPNGVAYDTDPSVYQDILKYVQGVTASISYEYATNLATESKARIDADKTHDDQIAALNSQIASIASLPSGSTSGDAEIIAARTGVDGTTYDNLGEAIRTQITNVQNQAKHLGMIASGTVDKATTSSASTATVDYVAVTLSAGKYVVRLSNYSNPKRARVYLQKARNTSNSDNVVRWYNYSSGTATSTAYNDVMLFELNATEAASVKYIACTSDSMTEAIHFDWYLYDEQQYNLLFTNQISRSLDDYGLIPLMFEWGSLDTGGVNSAAGFGYRIRTPKTNSLYLRAGDVIGITYPGIRFFVERESDYDQTAWLTSDYTIDTAGFYRLVVGVTPESGDFPSSISEIANKIHVVHKDSLIWNFLHSSGGGSSSESSLPDYYYEDNWLGNKIDAINNASAFTNGIVFPFITDLHFASNTKNSKYLLKEILAKTACTNVICGGDFAPAYGTEANLKATYDALLDYAGYVGHDNWFSIVGNHDFHINSQSGSAGVRTNWTWGKVYDAVIRPSERWIVNAYNNGGYYCLDNDVQKTRFVMMNSTEPLTNESTGEADGTPRVRPAQLTWLANVLTEKSNYNIVVFTHIATDPGMQYANANLIAIQNILEAFRNKTTYSGDISANFTTTTNTLVCHINGHDHADSSHVSNGVLSIATTCDAYYQDDGYGAQIGTVTEQAFDVYCIDYDARTIKTIRIGRGPNRNWTY